ncbi:hypothetical protein RB195_009674 [Necator americanus]|uniref:Cadherin domain-containing protein n=1 Tax=Necator americanus TaxID=51031 RepID=A0ABR1CW73_NECAM
MKITSAPPVKATNSLCGGSSRLRYAFQDGGNTAKLFNIDSTSGTICLEKHLDYEKEISHQLTVAAIDQIDGSTGTCLVSIRVLDANDNSPVFYPTQYNITVREGYKPSGPLVVLSATDDDEGIFGEVHFHLKSGNSALFEVNEKSGEIFLKKGLSRGKHELTVQAKDGSGSVSEEPANVHVYVIDSDASAPSFTQPSYVIKTPEDILPGISIGAVQATGPGQIRYSIYSGDPDHQFMINPDSGRITVARYLDADKHDRVILNVQAALMNGGSNQTQVVILIEDHNDNTPRFPIDLVEITVGESQAVHEPFYVVHATDKDKRKNGAISYSILSSHPPCPVMVQPHTGQLQLTDPLDFENIKDYRIRVKAQDHGIPPRSTNMTLVLHVSDSNDNRPIFETTSYEAEVPENSPLMTTVLKVRARDADSRENGKVLYRISNGSNAFGIDERTGMIYVNENIDRETKDIYHITVTAQDQGEPPLSSSVPVRIRIADVNDNAPSCTSVATMVVPRDSSPSTTVGTVVVTDPDNGANGTVVYRSQQSHPLFVVKNNGDVHLRRALAEADPTDVRLSIIASDQGVPRKSTVCHVQIRIGRGTAAVKIIEPFERNIRAPNSCQSSCLIRQLNATGVAKWQIQSNEISNHFSIIDGKLIMSSHPQSPPPWSLSLILSDREGRQKHLSLRILEPNSPVSSEPVKISPLLPIGSKIANFGPKLKEKNKNLYYSLKNQSSLFELDQANGDLYLMRKIRDLAGSEISLYYNLIDGLTSESEEKHIEFEVGSGFVDSPYFTEDFLRIPVAEDTAIGTIIASVNATSPDVSSSIVYRFAEPNNRFSIDQYAGEISVIEDLDWNESPHHLVVVATGGGAKASMLIVVDVLDVNNNHPEIISANEVVTFAEIGTVIHYVVATDDDYGRNATVSYDIITDTTNCFGIDHKTGALSMLRRPPTVDTTIVVRASDHGSPALFADQSLTIRVRNGSKKWSYFDDSELRVTISDAVPIGSIVTTLPVDGKAAIRLFPTSSTFKIDEYGKLTLLAAVNPGTYQLSVLAKSPQGEIDSLSVVVGVTASVKLGPRLSSASCGSISLPENRSLKNFKQIVALNATNEAKFSIRGSTKYFEIDSSTGRLSCPALDREEQSEHLLVVSIQDGDRKDSCTVRITVADENDSAPQFAASTPQVIFINDTVSLQDVVHKFSAFDHDIGVNGRILFDLVEDASFAFDLVPETGDLVLAREPEGVGNDWMIRVKVRDKGVPSLSVDRFVRIQSTRSPPTSRDTQPSFLRQKYVSSIDEGLSRGQIVSKVCDYRQTQPKNIDGDGVVRTSQELDYEIKDQYDLKIIATGAFSAQIRTQMTVEVNNVNDNPPVFPKQSQKKVLETLPEGSYITTMSANDADNLGALEYSLDPKEERFIIDRYTGIVHLATSLDFETVEEINVDVKVTDGNFTAATSFVVVVMDVNDNAPEFQQRFVDIKIPQSTGADEVIARLVAFDRDSGDNGRVSYTLAQSHELFQLNSNDGTLILLAPLPADADFLLTVTASDHGFPVMSSSIPVRVTVTSEEAQHRPEFPHTSYEFVVSESFTPHIAFGNVSVSSDPYFYRIMDSKASEVFAIDHLGRLYLRTAVDRETEDHYSFTVDVGSHPVTYHQNSTTTVAIRVTDVNDNSPVFVHLNWAVKIRDGMRSGEVLQRLAATDADYNENGRISYRILTGDDYGIFSVGPDTGALMFNQWNDDQLIRHSDGRWTLFVEARDHGSRTRSTLLPVQISLDLQTWSGSAPFFVVPGYVVPILETVIPDTPVFTARATNRFGIPMNSIRYDLKDSDQTFSIDPTNGTIRLKRELDYETKTTYKMSLLASDGNSRSAVVSLEFVVLPVDEFPPVFAQSSYTFQVPLDANPGAVIGEILAVDADGGTHGIPEYRVETSNDLVTVEKLTGLVSLRAKPDRRRNHTVEQITVIAASSGSQHTKTTVYLEIGDFPIRSANSTFSSNIFKVGAVATAILFVLLICLLGCCLFGYRSSKPKEIESPRKQVYSVSRGQANGSSNGISRLACSPRQALPSNITQKNSSMTSSTSSNSGLRNSLLSHREAASTRSQPDSGIDQDTISVNSSVTEYLISIGVNPNPIQSRPRYRRPDMIDSALNDYIYARVEDILPPGPVNMSENVAQLEGLYQFTQSRHAPPSFQPLTEIFDELEEIQREQKQKREREYIQVEI